MSEIKAGVVVKNKFCRATSSKFSDYIGYIDRSEAIRNEAIEKFNLYQDYMGNPEKTTGLFTVDKSDLTLQEKLNLKQAFKLAQENGSIMWQTVISFDNRWLAQNSLYDEENGLTDKGALENAARNSISKMLKAENMENAIWSGAIHYNTDNIHIHIAIAEIEPLRDINEKGKYAGELRGKFKLSSIEKCKSSIVNEIIGNQPENELINEIIRKNIIESKKSEPTIKDDDMAKLFFDIYKSMPDDKRLWNYRANGITEQRKELDKLTKLYIEKYHQKDFQELTKLLDIQDKRYREAYGKSSNYKANKIDDLYYRMGNTILKEMREYDKAEKKRIYDEARNRGYKLNQSDLKPYNQKGNIRDKEALKQLNNALSFLKIAMKNEYQSAKNQYQYELMKRESEAEKIQGEYEV